MSRCNCVRCIAQCMKFPGIFAPGEVEAAAVTSGMSLHDFIRAYVIFDFWTKPDGTKVWFPTPAKLIKPHHTHEGKAAFTYAFVPGRCIFLTADVRCEIYSARPAECRAVDSCIPGGSQWAQKLIEVWQAKQDRAAFLMAAHENVRQLDL